MPIDLSVNDLLIALTMDVAPAAITLAAPIDVNLSGQIDVVAEDAPVAIVVDDSIAVAAA